MLDSNQYDNLIPSETGSKSKSNFLEKKPSLSKRLCGEFIGTALLLSFGVGPHRHLLHVAAVASWVQMRVTSECAVWQFALDDSGIV